MSEGHGWMDSGQNGDCSAEKSLREGDQFVRTPQGPFGFARNDFANPLRMQALSEATTPASVSRMAFTAVNMAGQSWHHPSVVLQTA